MALAKRKTKREKLTTRKAGIERARAAATRAQVKITGADPQAKVDVLTAPLSWWRERWKDKNIRRQFIESFVYIRNKFDENKLVLMKFNPIQAYLHERRERKTVIVKARKQGLSRYFLACEFADAVVLPGQRVRIVPHDPETAEEFWGDLQTMYEMLPEHLKPYSKYFSQDLIHFHDPRKGVVDSRLKTSTVQPGSESKGRGQAITRLHVTEMPFWNGDQRKAAQALFEAAAEGEINVESTPQGMESFEALYQKGKKREGGWQAFAFEWWWLPEYAVAGAMCWQQSEGVYLTLWREDLAEPSKAVSEIERTRLEARRDAQRLTEKELALAPRIFAHLVSQGLVSAEAGCFCDEVAERLAWRRQKIEELEGGEADFLVEYLEDDESCFKQSGRPVVSSEYLKIGCQASEPVPGHEYFVCVDGSAGKERGDPSSIQVIDIWQGEQVHAEWLKRPPDAVAARACELSDKYGGALLIIERNSLGVALIQAAVDQGFESRLYSHPTTAQLRDLRNAKKTWEEIQAEAEFGFYTDKFNKPLMGRLLEQSLRKGELVLSSQQWIDEARHVFWLDNGGFAAKSGYNDDGFMALAIGWLVRVIYHGQFGGFVGVMPQTGELPI